MEGEQMRISDDIIYVGVNDHQIDLFEGQYVVPQGMAYNSYVVKDYKIAVMDTVDRNFTHEWLDNVAKALEGKKPDYLVVQHMEPDHSANIANFMKTYPEATIVSSQKAFGMMKNFFGQEFEDRRLIVGEGDELPLGKHVLKFIAAPMVHWPEVIMTYDTLDKVLFSADGFGKFGALDAEDDDWACEARRYYFGIVGKYGAQVQAVLKKAAALDIQKICPLHGPVLTDNLGYYIGLYDTWSSYLPESDGVCICYTSVYGHTKEAVEMLADELRAAGVPKVAVNDLARDDIYECVEDAFRYDTLVLATTTYNAGIFPYMREFIGHLTERGFQKRRVAFIENGSWAPTAMKVMQKELEPCKNMTYTKNNVTILSALNEESTAALKALAEELAAPYEKLEVTEEPKMDPTALFKIGYGLYVVTANDGSKQNGQIANTVTQVASEPNRIAVSLNKANYTSDIVRKTGVMNVCMLNEECPFREFKHFGFQSGRDVDKFADYEHYAIAANGVAYLTRYANAYISLKVFDTVDMGSHWMFICDITESVVLNQIETMTYSYYQKNVKQKPDAEKKGWVCDICGYVYEGEELPEDFVCPLCKHPASDFSKL